MIREKAVEMKKKNFKYDFLKTKWRHIECVRKTSHPTDCFDSADRFFIPEYSSVQQGNPKKKSVRTHHRHPADRKPSTGWIIWTLANALILQPFIIQLTNKINCHSMYDSKLIFGWYSWGGRVGGKYQITLLSILLLLKGVVC